jgi:hypothetical protein
VSLGASDGSVIGSRPRREGNASPSTEPAGDTAAPDTSLHAGLGRIASAVLYRTASVAYETVMNGVPTGTREELTARLREAERAVAEAGQNHTAALKRLQAEGYPAMFENLKQSMAELSLRREEIRVLKAVLFQTE